MLNRRRALMASATPSDLFLIKDILTLDGIQNTLTGHSSSAKTWKNLTGDSNFDFARAASVNPVWNADNIQFDASANKRFTSGENAPTLSDKTAISIEIVAAITGNGGTSSSGNYYGMLFNNHNATGNGYIRINQSSADGGIVVGYHNSKKIASVSAANNAIHYYCFVLDANGGSLYVDGSLVGSNAEAAFDSSVLNNVWNIGGSGSSSAPWYPKAKIYRVGIQGRAFTASEIASRSLYFKNRFNF